MKQNILFTLLFLLLFVGANYASYGQNLVVSRRDIVGSPVQAVNVMGGKENIVMKGKSETKSLDAARLFAYTLQQNYPNPFNPVTSIGFSLEATANISLNVYNVLGQEVASLIHNEQREAGEHSVEFDGSKFTSGVYFYRLTARSDEGKGSSIMRKMMLLK